MPDRLGSQNKKLPKKTIFTKVKLSPELERFLDGKFPTRQIGIRKCVKVYMGRIKPMDDPKNEEVKNFLLRLYSNTDGVIPSFTEIMSVVQKGFGYGEKKTGDIINKIMKEGFLKRVGNEWKISEERKDDFVAEFKRLFG